VQDLTWTRDANLFQTHLFQTRYDADMMQRPERLIAGQDFC
jgi:hypothetical protein